MRPLIAFVALVALCSCSQQVLPPLPEGEQTVTGILLSAPLSAVRRGSHFIEQDGVNVYYAESSLINLRDYEGKRVTLRGFLEHNTDTDDLSVLVAHSVVDVEETTQEYTLSEISVLVTVPIQWKMVKREGLFQFRPEGDEDPLLTIWQSEGTELPDGGVPIVVDATRATRLIDDLSGTQIVAIKRSDSIMQLRFSPGKRTNADRLLENFIDVLKSVHLVGSSSSSSALPQSGSGALGNPCGGSAGVLCPAGSFCDIQDFQENIGHCRTL